MRIIKDWQYRYIEKALYGYHELQSSTLSTERLMVISIDNALQFFKGTAHEVMMKEFYFKANIYRKQLTNSGHFKHICDEFLHTEEPNGYVIRREIVYRVAMNCYAANLFKLENQN